MASASSAAGRRVARLCRHVTSSDTSTTTRNTVATTTSGGGAGGGAGAADSALLAAAPTASSYTESEANNVPWLPLPSLADTMARLQEFAGPVCSKADMEDLAAAVREFLADPNAHVLQKVWSPMRAAIQTTASNSHHCTVCHFLLTAFGGAPQSEAPPQLYAYIHYCLPGYSVCSLTQLCVAVFCWPDMLDFWRHMYLSGRYPIAINVNPWLA